MEGEYLRKNLQIVKELVYFEGIYTASVPTLITASSV